MPKRTLFALAMLALSPLVSVGSAATPKAEQKRADQLVGATPGTVSFAARCGDLEVGVGESIRLRAASTLKVAAVLAASEEATGASGSELSNDSTIRTAIIDSSNSAANTVIDRAGGLAAVESFMRELGMRQTDLDARYGEALGTMAKATSAQDLVKLAEATRQLANEGTGPLVSMGLNRAQGQALVGLMTRTTHPSLFGGVGVEQVAHKSGWLDTAENDVALISTQSGTTCVAGLLTEGTGVGTAQHLGRQLTEEVIVPLSATRTASLEPKGEAPIPEARTTPPDAPGSIASLAMAAIRALW